MFAEYIVKLFPAILFYQFNLFNFFIVYETKDLINWKAWEECKILWIKDLSREHYSKGVGIYYL